MLSQAAKAVENKQDRMEITSCCLQGGRVNRLTQHYDYTYLEKKLVLFWWWFHLPFLAVGWEIKGNLLSQV